MDISIFESILYALIVQCCYSTVIQPTVTTKNGSLQGFTFTLTSNISIDEFRGIPYAAPPVGDLRFKRPQPAPAWTGVKNVSTDQAACIHNNHPKPGESEDCLYLDVYRPHGAVHNSQLPVMVFIHGGNNLHGSKNQFNGTVLAARGVIVVIINYRLGPFGFLSTEDSTMPGNYGMLDQVAALQWVQENIAAFGGDPRTVTLFGDQAGGADISLHILSPLSKGLFARAIMMNGCSSASRIVTPPQVQVTPKMLAVAAGAQLGCSQSGDSFLTCMQSKNAKDLYTACLKASRSDVSLVSFRPRVENVFGFLPDYPLSLFRRGAFNQVNVLSGFNAQEKGDLSPVGDKDNDGLTVEEFRALGHRVLNDFPYLNATKYLLLLEDIYLLDKTDPFEIRASAIKMMTDFMYVAPMVLEAQTSRQHSHGTKYFLYEFNHMPSYNNYPAWTGVQHALNIPFVFGFPWKLLGNYHARPNATDEKVSDMMMTMWTNFAKVGDPTPLESFSAPLIRWQQLYPKRLSYLLIEEQLQHMQFSAAQQTAVLQLYTRTVDDYLAALQPALPVVG